MTSLQSTAEQLSAQAFAALGALQSRSGEFPSFRSFRPGVAAYGAESDYDGWRTFGSCPFFTATITLHLSLLDLPAMDQVRASACRFLESTLENSLVRYVPARSQAIWFPTDIDDTCLVQKVLKDAGFAVPSAELTILANRRQEGGFYTWFVPRARLWSQPVTLGWLVLDWAAWSIRLSGQNLSNCWRLQREYWRTSEPAVDANVLLYFGDDPRVSSLADFILESIGDASTRIEYYDSMLGVFFHVGRLVQAGHVRLLPAGGAAEALIATRQGNSGKVDNDFDTAAAALTLMYFGRWDSPSLVPAIEALVASPMHARGWQPLPYVNPVNREFSDGCPGLTCLMFAEALHRFAHHGF